MLKENASTRQNCYPEAQTVAEPVNIRRLMGCDTSADCVVPGA